MNRPFVALPTSYRVVRQIRFDIHTALGWMSCVLSPYIGMKLFRGLTSITAVSKSLAEQDRTQCSRNKGCTNREMEEK